VKNGSHLRNKLSHLVALFAALAIVMSVTGLWANHTVLNSREFGSVVNQSMRKPDVSSALAKYVTDETVTVLKIPDLLKQSLPDNLTSAAPILTGALRTIVQEQVTKVVETDAIRTIVVALARTAHKQAMNLLQSNGIGISGVKVVNGTITLNLVPVVATVLNSLQDQGLLPASVKVAAIDQSKSPVEQVKQLSDSLGVDLPQKMGQLEVYQSSALGSSVNALAQAQRALTLFKRFLFAIVLLALALTAATIFSASDKWRGTRHLGETTVLGFSALLIAVHHVIPSIGGLASSQSSQAAINAILRVSTRSLNKAGVTAIVLGACVALYAPWRKEINELVQRHRFVAKIGVTLAIIAYLDAWGLSLPSFLGVVILTGATYQWANYKPPTVNQ